MISIFTPSHNPRYLQSAYESLLAQTFKDWEWIALLNNGAHWICDDTRVKILYDDSCNTNIGYLKRESCKLCKGEILLELDHDDELLPTALEEVDKAFAGGCDFAYSNTINHDVRSNTPVVYGSAYGWSHRDFEYRGLKCAESVSAAPFPQSISRILFAPNHLRAWGREFYWKIGGHDPKMSVADDHDLICRTYNAGLMVHIDKPLYFYRVDGNNSWLKNQHSINTGMWENHRRYIYPMAEKWAGINNLRRIDLCGGIDPAFGYESMDIDGGAITTDLNHHWPLDDNSVGVIRAHDAIEHLRDPIHTMNEAYRVLAHGGFLLIQVPSSDGVGAYCDPTHVSFWNTRSFRYYTEAGMQRYIKAAGANCRFQKILVENQMRYDGVKYVDAHLVAVKSDSPRFYGELLI